MEFMVNEIVHLIIIYTVGECDTSLGLLYCYSSYVAICFNLYAYTYV